MKRRFLPIRLIRVIRGCFSQGQKLPGRWWRAEDRAIGSSKGHSHPAKKYIDPGLMFGYMSGNRYCEIGGLGLKSKYERCFAPTTRARGKRENCHRQISFR